MTAENKKTSNGEVHSYSSQTTEDASCRSRAQRDPPGPGAAKTAKHSKANDLTEGLDSGVREGTLLDIYR